MGPPNEQNKSNTKPGFPEMYFILRGRDHYVQKVKNTMFYFNCVMGWVSSRLFPSQPCTNMHNLTPGPEVSLANQES